MKLLIDILMSQLGKPYIFGGKSPVRGFDCSGLVEWGLESVGFNFPGNYNAQMLRDYFYINGFESLAQPGALVFFGKSNKQVSHVGFLINPLLMIEAGGGESDTLTVDEAEKRQACVRIRPYTRRKDVVDIIMPVYPDWMKESDGYEVI